MNREESIAGLREGGPFDLLIIGGGATGLGAAVDGASRGHRVALVEAHDFAKGTSSRSTKLVHGGVRYLKQGNLALVRGALRERGRLGANAPQLVHDLPFVIPAYAWMDRPFYGIGLTLYDMLAGKLSFGRSRVLNREETIRHLPTVAPEGLRGGVLYHDGQFDDARLAIGLARTAAAHGAVLANYVRAVSLIKHGGRVCGAVLKNAENGDGFELRAKAVINATGIFADELRHEDDAEAREVVTVSQGAHVVLPKRFLPGSAAMMVPKTADGRVLFAVPWHDRVIVGTTDTPRPKAEIEPRALPEELAFLMEHAAGYLSCAPEADDVLSVFAGLRPLVRKAGTMNTAALSRDHTILVSDSGLVTVTGGKWTTYRKMGEDVIDRAEQVAGLARKPCVTTDLRILHAREERESGSPLHASLPISAEQVRRFVGQEMARTLEDALSRRSRCLLLDAEASIEIAPEVARLMAEQLQRGDDWLHSQIEAFRQLASGYRMLGNH